MTRDPTHGFAKEIDFVVHPRRTIPDLIGRGNSIAARGRLAGKTAADGGEVNLSAHLFFAHSAKLLEPAKQSAARGPRERFAENRLFHTRRLADEHDLAEDGPT
jgi:hypothetical protein